jgi:hypothetical protein
MLFLGTVNKGINFLKKEGVLFSCGTLKAEQKLLK